MKNNICDEYIIGTKNWIEQAKNRLAQSIENEKYLWEKMILEAKELELIKQDIEHSKLWIEKTEKELQQYIDENSKVIPSTTPEQRQTFD